MNLETLAPYLLPLAMGLAGAALYHLFWPVLRGAWLVLRVLAYPLWMSVGFVGFLFGMHDESPQGWGRRLFPKKPPKHDATLRFGRSDDDYTVIELVNCTDDKSPSVNVKYDGAMKFVAVNQRLDALEERMNEVEEPIDADAAWVRDANKRWAKSTCISESIPGSYVGIGRMTYQQWREFVENSARAYRTVTGAALARIVTCGESDSAVPYSTPAGHGRPCPRPTKDLRPGDEVSIRARVTTVGENRIQLDEPKDTPNAYLHVAVDVDELNKIRTDNK